jgi:hypothetical protein
MHFAFPHMPLLKTRASRLRVIRLALFAVVLNAWAPTVTALLAASAGMPVAMPAHCLAMTQQSAQQDSAQPGAPQKTKGASCPFCFAHAGSTGLTPVIYTPPAPHNERHAPAPVALLAMPASQVWLNCRSRGPPVLS